MALENAKDFATPLVELCFLTVTKLDTKFGSFEFAGQIVLAIAHHRVVKAFYVFITAFNQAGKHDTCLLIYSLKVFMVRRNLGGEGVFQITNSREVNGVSVGQVVELAGERCALDFQLPVFWQDLESSNFRVKLLETGLLNG